MDKKRIKIVFFGTPEFAVESLDRLIKDGCDIAAVVTMPDKVAGRGHKLLESDVKKFALSKNIRVLQPTNLKSEEFIKELKEINADLFIVIAFRMLPESVWSMPSLGTFNLHASLLPRYRGAAPINHALINGDDETGVTTFFLKHEIDTGDIIDQLKIKIEDEDNAGTLHDKLMHLGAEMVSDTVKMIKKGKVKTRPQPKGEFINAPKIFKETCKIDWNRDTERVHNQIRGLSPYPAAWSIIKDSNGKESSVKIMKTERPPDDINEVEMTRLRPGELKYDKKHLFVKTGDGFLEIIELQPAGKKTMKASEYLRGYKPIEFVD